ncbi:MAG: F0F1 ATP synthase subunit A [Chitinophagaceae bacterium]|nr:F0F1 ATP synthase subunit A [Chitinophagaceae bacterium]
MVNRRIKSLLILSYSLFCLLFSRESMAQHDEHEQDQGQAHAKKEKKGGFDANEVIFGHVLDAHEYHFLSYEGSDGKEHHATIPLPVILYSPQRGLDVFMSSEFHHGHEIYKGYKLVEGKIHPVNGNGSIDGSVQVYDLSLTRNVVQMLLALTIFVLIMLGVAKKYKSGIGKKQAPTGMQNAIEAVIVFIRDDVAKPNLGHKYLNYMPYLLTVFFFILINNIFGLIPGSANVTGNIAFTLVLGVISFFVIVFSSSKHFWSHIFNPPGVPGFVKPILILVEFLGVFIKPFALIIRLFANMVAGHIIIICLISLIFIFGQLNAAAGWGASPVAVGFTIFIYMIEVLVAFLQAYIFTTLTAVFIGLAREEPHHGDDHKHHPELSTAKYDDPVIV